MLWAAVVDWFSGWWDASDHYSERPPLAVSLIMAGLACAALLAIVVDPGGVAGALLTPAALAPIVLTGLLLCKWVFEDDAVGLALVVVASLVAATGAAALLAPWLHASSEASQRWLMAFSLLNLLLGAYLQGRGWALLLWYFHLEAAFRGRAARTTAALAAPRNDKDFLVEVLSVQGDRIRLELRDGDGARVGFTTSGALKKKLHQGGRYLVTGAQLAEEQLPDESGGYRQNRLAVRVLAAEECELAGVFRHGLSFAPEIRVAVAMLLLQHVLLGAAAALLGPLI
ncbi:MAG: hypothetical protein WKG00_39760 [Polyangiaceae bacterium]